MYRNAKGNALIIHGLISEIIFSVANGGTYIREGGGERGGFNVGFYGKQEIMFNVPQKIKWKLFEIGLF